MPDAAAIIIALIAYAIFVVVVSVVLWVILWVLKRIPSGLVSVFRKKVTGSQLSGKQFGAAKLTGLAKGHAADKGGHRRPPIKIKINEFLIDFLSPMTNLDLMQKYEISSSDRLHKLFQKAIDQGHIDPEDLRLRTFIDDWRKGTVHRKLEAKHELAPGTLLDFLELAGQRGFLEQSEIEKMRHQANQTGCITFLKEGVPYLALLALAYWWSFWWALFFLSLYLAIRYDVIRDVVTILRGGKLPEEDLSDSKKRLKRFITFQLANFLRNLDQWLKFLFLSGTGKRDGVKGFSAHRFKYVVIGLSVLFVGIFLVFRSPDPVPPPDDEFEALELVNPVIEAEALEKKGQYCDALEYLEYFREYEYARNDSHVDRCYRRIKEARESWWYRFEDTWAGIWRGKGACFESVVSATASDFIGIGDVRDLIGEGSNLVTGGDTDELTLAMAGIGVALTATTIATVGGAGPVKVSASLIKVTHKLNKIPKTLQMELIKIFNRCKESKSLKSFVPVVDHMTSLMRDSNLKVKDVIALISRSKSVDELKRMKKIAAAYGKGTGKFMRLGGDHAVEAFKRFEGQRELPQALDAALQYGPKGTNLLLKHGPEKFLEGMLKPRTILGQKLTAIGRPRPGPAYHAHHIVAFEHSKAVESRKILERFKIDLNSPNNGSWLYQEVHSRVHTNRYFDEVNRRLRQARSREEVLEVLKKIETDLAKGSFPR